jgi:sec-independent protein translocase protein TatA
MSCYVRPILFESVWDWVIVIIVALVLFGGASKVPQLARAFGRAVGEFKKGQMEVEKELRSLQEGSAAPTATQTQTPEDRQRRISELQKELEQLKSQDSQDGR